MLFDSGASAADRLIMLKSVHARQPLTESENCYTDRTFKVCPLVFYQLFTFPVQRGGRILPYIFVLLSNKIKPPTEG